jgi:hypothetical protein
LRRAWQEHAAAAEAKARLPLLTDFDDKITMYAELKERS